jgi:4-amino-4-deoxy-L-arabinose transferase-like glycosyltransferase
MKTRIYFFKIIEFLIIYLLGALIATAFIAVKHHFHFNTTYSIVGFIVVILLTAYFIHLTSHNLEKQTYLWTYGGGNNIRRQLDRIPLFVKRPDVLDYIRDYLKYYDINPTMLNYYDCVKTYHLKVLHKSQCGSSFESWFPSSEDVPKALEQIIQYHQNKLNYYNI